MNYEEEIAQIKKDFETITNDLKRQVTELSRKLESHKHNGYDMTAEIDGTLTLKDQSFLIIGNSQVAAITQNAGLSTESNNYFLGAGPDRSVGFSDTSKNTQLTLQHLPGTNGGTNQSFFYGQRPPLFSTHLNSVVSITSGTATLTDTTKNWSTSGSGELFGATVNVYDSTGTFKESRTITANTATQMTVDSNWTFTDASSSYVVYMPVYFGSADYPWRRLYTGEGTGCGIRFGTGPTAGGQNGLLYMDSVGDLYWRNKAGASVKLN